MGHLQSYMNYKVEVVTVVLETIGAVTAAITYEGVLVGYDPDGNGAIEIQIQVKDKAESVLKTINWSHVLDVTLL